MLMKYSLVSIYSFTTTCLIATLTGCAAPNANCEEIAEINQQLAQCKILRKQISNAKSVSTVLKSELERRYQTDCVDSRYYRDKQQDAVCHNKESIKAIKNQ